MRMETVVAGVKDCAAASPETRRMIGVEAMKGMRRLLPGGR